MRLSNLGVVASLGVSLLAGPTFMASAESPDPLIAAAQAGNPAAENAIAYKILMGYMPGHNVPDPELAMTWYERAAVQGLPEAQNSLGMMWEQGATGRTDYVQAAKWYRQAADQDFPRAQIALARLYESGNGVPQNDDIAIAWYRKAAEHGLPEGKDRADAIEVRRIAAAEAEKAAIEQRQRDDIQRQHDDAQNRKLTAAFRKTVKKGTDSHCGLIVSTDGPIATVQGPAPIGQFAIRIDQLYPPGVAPCNFFNGRYQNPGLPY